MWKNQMDEMVSQHYETSETSELSFLGRNVWDFCLKGVWVWAMADLWVMPANGAGFSKIPWGMRGYGLIEAWVKRGSTPGEPDRKKPYQHDGVIAVATGFFTGQAPIAERVEAMFVRNEAGNYEATPPMVAISCAVLSDAMNDLSTGEHKFAKFEGSRVQDIYDVHIQLLATPKQTKPVRYHSTMEMIFTKAS
ncbi:hypothetical protein B0H14DRAFT_2565490 [Mycena olivaceomarginata]|nr:hypothetical protein B0H14DRAFT_2565490 [Mycena olivaceomarginata]